MTDQISSEGFKRELTRLEGEVKGIDWELKKKEEEKGKIQDITKRKIEQID